MKLDRNDIIAIAQEVARILAPLVAPGRSMAEEEPPPRAPIPTSYRQRVQESLQRHAAGQARRKAREERGEPS